MFREIANVPLSQKVSGQVEKPGALTWLAIDALVIDGRYQRELGEGGKFRVRQIAANFNWNRFTPIICAKAENGKYAIIDGQHRVTAALARGDILKVPAWVVDAEVMEQARAFLSINATTARVPSGAMWYARKASGDEDAILTFALCDKAGVRILKFGLDRARRKSNDTNAASEIDQARRAHGDGPVLRALQILRITGELKSQSLITSLLVRAAVTLCRGDWSKSDAQLIAVRLKSFDFYGAEARAALTQRKEGGTKAQHMITALRNHALNARFAA